MAPYFLAVLAVLALAPLVLGHGILVSPRKRGSLRTQRNVVPQNLVEEEELAQRDYCDFCQNGSGVNETFLAGPWRPYEPMEGNTRGGFGICGDKEGDDHHMKTGKFANPESMPFVENYQPGGVANFEFDFTTNHGGWLEFWICDVEQNPNQDIQWSTFAQDCHYLERVPNDSCKGGGDEDCGPIDSKWPGRWVLPCRISKYQKDQVIGGSNGKMAYQLPDVEIKVGVVHAYWSTRHSCSDEMMVDYEYPKAWQGCKGDGGSIGGKLPHNLMCGQERDSYPEEFFICSDVQMTNDGIGGGGDDEDESEADITPEDTGTAEEEVEGVPFIDPSAPGGNTATTGATVVPDRTATEATTTEATVVPVVPDGDAAGKASAYSGRRAGQGAVRRGPRGGRRRRHGERRGGYRGVRRRGVRRRRRRGLLRGRRRRGHFH